MGVARIALLVALALFALGACRDDEGPDDPAATTSSSSPSTTIPGTTSTTPAPRGDFGGIWPFTTQAEVDAYAAGSERAYRDPSMTARQFASLYLGMKTPASFSITGTGAAQVGVGPPSGEGGRSQADPRATTFVALEQLGPEGPNGPWSVVGARSPKIELESPEARARVSSPLTVTGKANAFEGTVAVRVKEDGMASSHSLGQGFVTGSGDSSGQLGPFRGEVRFRNPTKPGGAIVLYEDSAAENQGVLRATVVRVFFAP